VAGRPQGEHDRADLGDDPVDVVDDRLELARRLRVGRERRGLHAEPHAVEVLEHHVVQIAADALALADQGELLVRRGEPALVLQSIGDVSHRGEHVLAAVVERAERDLDRNRQPVGALQRQLEPRPHRTLRGVPVVPLPHLAWLPRTAAGTSSSTCRPARSS
jgi:DNA polymerase III epsilon subunit-like protein